MNLSENIFAKFSGSGKSGRSAPQGYAPVSLIAYDFQQGESTFNITERLNPAFGDLKINLQVPSQLKQRKIYAFVSCANFRGDPTNGDTYLRCSINLFLNNNLVGKLPLSAAGLLFVNYIDHAPIVGIGNNALLSASLPSIGIFKTFYATPTVTGVQLLTPSMETAQSDCLYVNFAQPIIFPNPPPVSFQDAASALIFAHYLKAEFDTVKVNVDDQKNVDFLRVYLAIESSNQN